MKRSRLWALGVALVAAWLLSVCWKMSFSQGRPEAGKVEADPGVQLHLSTSSTQLRCGEVIPLELTFTSTTPNRYQINMAQYDRSGRMNYEQFLLDPKEGTSDPLQLYFNSAWGFIGGGLTGFKFLSTSPTTIQLDLNEWVRFDQPGTYRLGVISRRVNDTRASDNGYGGSAELTSNIIVLRITSPDPAWQHAQLIEIREKLERGGGSGGDVRNDLKQAALKALRYLGSEEAARELAQRLRGEDNHADWECMFGLIGSPHRDAGLEEMNKLLEDPLFPISDLFLTTMSILPLRSGEDAESLRKQRDDNLKELRRRLINALSGKRGKALAATLDTAMSGADPKMSPELRSELVSQLIETFSALPGDKQAAWLQYRWQEVKDPKWLPLLRATALHYEDFAQPREMHAYQSLQVTAAALRDWYELDPEGARDSVIAEITRPKPRYNANTLGLLPDKSLPEAEQAIAGHFVAADSLEIEGNLASLLFRYADAAVLPEVLGKVESLVGKWACEPQDKALAYVLKADPETARPLIERAIAARGPDSNACRHMIFTDIGALQNGPVLEELAGRSLSDPDPEVANNAVNYLGKYGSADAEQPLWNRYEARSREWSGRAAELRFVPAGENPHVWDANLGQSLARALASGTAWLSDESKLRRIQALGVGANIQQETEQALQAWLKRPFNITYDATSPPSFTLAQYNQLSLDSLKKKLAQFPKGTKFVLPPADPNPSPEEEKVREEIFRFAEKNGITVMCAPGS
jgi:hypothetical protein